MLYLANMEVISLNIGKKLRELRIKHAMTQSELAEKSGVSRVTISKLENDSDSVTTNTTLLRLSKALGCSAEYFFKK